MTTDKFARLENQLRQTWEDQHLSKTEKYALQHLALACSDEERRFLANRSFEIVKEHVGQSTEAMSAFLWLERVIKALQRLAIREDTGPDHMHHKFTVFDKKAFLNGSFNWTRSATKNNYENLTLNHHPALV